MTHIYTAAGALLPASAYGNPFAFTGQRHDAAVALYHFWYRTYSPSLGRWHQRDPIGYVDGASLYEYCRADPFGGVDQFGAMYITPDTVIRTGAPAAPFVIELGGAAGAAGVVGEVALVAGSAYLGWSGGNWLVENTSVENHVGNAIYLHNSLDPMGMTPTAMYWAGSHCVRIGQQMVCTTATAAAYGWSRVEEAAIRAQAAVADTLLDLVVKFAHRKGKSKSKQDKHQKGERREKDYEKGDERRPYKDANKRRSDLCP
jgi:RHS repeat-associated protein